MARRNGVDDVIRKEIILNGGTEPEAMKTIAESLGITVEAIYAFKRKGWFPLERARQIADQYGMPLADLVRADIREALLANNS